MPERNHDDQQHVVGDGVDDPVVPYPDTEAWPPPKSAGGGRAWILGQQCDGALDAVSNRRIQLA